VKKGPRKKNGGSDRTKLVQEAVNRSKVVMSHFSQIAVRSSKKGPLGSILMRRWSHPVDLCHLENKGRALRGECRDLVCPFAQKVRVCIKTAIKDSTHRATGDSQRVPPGEAACSAVGGGSLFKLVLPRWGGRKTVLLDARVTAPGKDASEGGGGLGWVWIGPNAQTIYSGKGR